MLLSGQKNKEKGSEVQGEETAKRKDGETAMESIR